MQEIPDWDTGLKRELSPDFAELAARSVADFRSGAFRLRNVGFAKAIMQVLPCIV
jgi:hypothetical protein